MAKLVACFVAALVVCQSVSVLSRQIDLDQFDLNQSGNGNNNVEATTRPSTPFTTTPSPAYVACLNRCQSTPQYNPVCGTDQISYNNINRLRCAQNCGLRVDVLHIGTCGPSAGGK